MGAQEAACAARLVDAQCGRQAQAQCHLSASDVDLVCGCAVFTGPVGKEVLLFIVVLMIIPTYLEGRRSLVPKELQEEPFRPFPFLNLDE